jgi:hypothetical protein
MKVTPRKRIPVYVEPLSLHIPFRGEFFHHLSSFFDAVRSPVIEAFVRVLRPANFPSIPASALLHVVLFDPVPVLSTASANVIVVACRMRQ